MSGLGGWCRGQSPILALALAGDLEEPSLSMTKTFTECEYQILCMQGPGLCGRYRFIR